MKAILLAAGICAGLAAFAADTPPPPASPAPAHAWAENHSGAFRNHGWRSANRGTRMRRLARRLGLDDAQLAQVRHLHAQTMVQVWSARADGTLTVDQLHAKVRAAFKDQRDGFRNLLTDEQRAQLDQMTGRTQTAPKP